MHRGTQRRVFGGTSARLDRSDLLVEKARSARLVAEMSEFALRSNFDVIAGRVPSQSLLPMIKADAYGHGAPWAARILAFGPLRNRLYGLGAATLDEAILIRQAIGLKGRKVRVFVFSGASPWEEWKGALCEEYDLTPMISTDLDWKSFLSQGWQKRLSYEIKFNTGMNRLGLEFSSLERVRSQLKKMLPEERPGGIFSHLAIAENPTDKLTQEQVSKFKKIRESLSTVAPQAHFHLGNSSAIWNAQRLGLEGLGDVVRPGLALYGIAPWKGAPDFGLIPVMCWKSRVIAIRTLTHGDRLGYGGAWRVDQATTLGGSEIRVAILGVGYADGLPRSLSPRGQVVLRGCSVEFLGRISMDLAAVRAPAGATVGDWAEWIGPNIDIWKQAEAAGTLPYELLTSLSTRALRDYDHAAK
jgi:alanine racemase